MNICFFNDIGFLGGGELWVMRAARLLEARGHKVSIVCPHRSELQVAALKEGRDLYVYMGGIDGFPFHDGLFHFLAERQIDVLYCTVMGNFCEARVLEQIVRRVNADRAGSELALVLKSGLPPIGDLSAEYYGAGGGAELRRLHVVSQGVKDTFLEWQPIFGEGFVEVFYEGVELTRFDGRHRSRGLDRSRWNLAPDQIAVTCLARLIDGMKGQSVMLRAVARLLPEHPQTVFFIAGEGDDREMLEELSDDLGVREAVRFTGAVEDTPSLLGASDILCHPSLNDGIPNAVVEAMAMGLPVVASRVGGVPEVVQDGVTGLLVRPNDVLSLEAALRRLLSDAGLRRRFARSSRRSIEDRFDLGKNLDALTSRLDAELSAFRSAPRQRAAPALPKITAPTPVLCLMHVIRTGGEETELAILARHLDHRKFTMSVISWTGADEASPALDTLRAWNIPVDATCNAIPNDADKVQYIVDKIRRERIGIVVACQDASLAYQVFRHLDPGECRLIEHGGIIDDATRTAKDRTTRYIGVSREITAAAATMMPSAAHAVFIPSMVDTEPFDSPDFAAARAWSADWIREHVVQPSGVAGEPCLVAFVGRLDPKKRVEHLVQAARSLLHECPSALFLIIGGHDAYAPHYAPWLYRQAADLVAAKRLVFTGPRGDVAGLLSASDILVLPSVGEGMAHVINEAGAAGLAVIATDDGAAREQLEDGRCGCVIEPGNVEQLTAALRSLITDRDRRTALGRRLRDRVRDNYSAVALVRQWHAVLEDAARGLAPGRRPRKITPRLRMLPAGEPLSFPTAIQIQTNTACNATCVMCPFPEVSKEVSMGRMDEGLYRDILAQCAVEPTLARIEPFLMNEPFTDKRIVDWIALAKATVPQAQVTVTTNGSLVTPQVSDRLGASNLDAIWFSLNGATKETYEKIMGISYDKVMRNIDYLLENRPASLRVYTNMIETTLMEPEIAANVRFWRSRGVESGPSQLVNRAGNVRNFDDLNYMPLGERPIRVCELVFYRMYILYNGDVVLCCMDWRRQAVLGNLKKQTMREVWHGDRYQEIREKLVRRQPTSLDLCSACSYTYK